MKERRICRARLKPLKVYIIHIQVMQLLAHYRRPIQSSRTFYSAKVDDHGYNPPNYLPSVPVDTNSHIRALRTIQSSVHIRDMGLLFALLNGSLISLMHTEDRHMYARYAAHTKDRHTLCSDYNAHFSHSFKIIHIMRILNIMSFQCTQ